MGCVICVMTWSSDASVRHLGGFHTEGNLRLGFNTKDRRRDMGCVICVMTWSSDASVRASRCFSY